MGGVPVHGRGVGKTKSFRSLQPLNILNLYEYRRHAAPAAALGCHLVFLLQGDPAAAEGARRFSRTEPLPAREARHPNPPAHPSTDPCSPPPGRAGAEQAGAVSSERGEDEPGKAAGSRQTPSVPNTGTPLPAPGPPAAATALYRPTPPVLAPHLSQAGPRPPKQAPPAEQLLQRGSGQPPAAAAAPRQQQVPVRHGRPDPPSPPARAADVTAPPGAFPLRPKGTLRPRPLAETTPLAGSRTARRPRPPPSPPEPRPPWAHGFFKISGSMGLENVCGIIGSSL